MITKISLIVGRFGCLEEEQKSFLTKTFKKYPAQKGKLLSPQNRYIGHKGEL